MYNHVQNPQTNQERTPTQLSSAHSLFKNCMTRWHEMNVSGTAVTQSWHNNGVFAQSFPCFYRKLRNYFSTHQNCQQWCWYNRAYRAALCGRRRASSLVLHSEVWFSRTCTKNLALGLSIKTLSCFQGTVLRHKNANVIYSTQPSSHPTKLVGTKWTPVHLLICY